MTTKHTPGPWDINYNDSSNPIVGADNQVVARVAHLAAWRHPLEAEANATLIAAAPDLLEALREAVRIINTECTWLYRSQSAIQGFEQAIAKAEGR